MGESHFIKVTAISGLLWVVIGVAVGILSVFSWANRSFGQVPALEAGSAAAARAVADFQRRAIDSEIAWRQATKITRDKNKVIPSKPPQQNSVSPKEYHSGQTTKADYWAWTVLSIVDENNCLLRCGDTTIWLADYPTGSLSDGTEVRILDTIRVGTTKKYEAVSGAKKTVLSVSLLSLEEQATIDAKNRKIKEANMERFLKKNGTEVIGDFISSEDGIVTIRDADGFDNEHKLSEFATETFAKIRKLTSEKPYTVSVTVKGSIIAGELVEADDKDFTIKTSNGRRQIKFKDVSQADAAAVRKLEAKRQREEGKKKK